MYGCVLFGVPDVIHVPKHVVVHGCSMRFPHILACQAQRGVGDKDKGRYLLASFWSRFFGVLFHPFFAMYYCN